MAGKRTWRCALALIAGTLALLAGGLALYARHAVLSQQAFASRAVGTLAQDEVRDELVDRISQRLVDAHPELADQRPELDAAAGDAVGSPQFAGEFYAGAAALHRELFTDDAHPAQLVIPGTGASVRADFLARVRTSSPRRAVQPALLAPTDPQLMALGGGRLETGLRDAAPWGRQLAALWPFALAAAVLLLALAVLLAPARRRGLRRAALAVAVGGGAIVAATTIAKALVLSTFDTSHGHAVVGTIWNAYLGELRLWGLAVGAGALVVAALVEPGTRGDWRRALAAPRGAGARLVRAGVLAAVAALLVVAPEVPLDLALIAAAGALVFSAATEVARLTAR